MFIAVYRYTLKPGMEDQFRVDWAMVTYAGIYDGKSLGSSLGQAADGSWVAVGRWPTKQQRDDWFARNTDIVEPLARMRKAMDQRFDDLEVDVTDELSSTVSPSTA